ncbi:Glycosyltransferase involved in cell wall bisynthesis [Sphingomonas gellani]|uniref:Glycosyltransferase involved in cell wall bisynthesis n=1 Tax=Sphingomonas gellani TaxID=1166340 RepID=A0A1H8HYA5_9SPHN|nr:Glycosyltransferase involved in cell wall bisynthesis [Sphingomonas gellani]
MVGVESEEVASRPDIAVIGLRGVPEVIGGIETHCELLYPALAQAAPELAVLLLVRRRHVPFKRTRLAGIPVRALPSLPGSGAETVSHTLIGLFHARWLRSRLVHLHGIGPAFFAGLARLLGMRVVVTHHAADFARPKWGGAGQLFLRLGEAMAARFADRVICVSDAVRSDFLSRHPGANARAVTIRNAARLDAVEDDGCRRVLDMLGLSRGGYVLAVGRLEATKRFEDLIAAHARAGRNALPLVIVGASVDGTEHEDALRAMADLEVTSGAGSRIIFAGFRTGVELAALYCGAALLIHPSEMEGFGLVVLEGMIAKVPIRLSDIPPHREFGLPDRCYFPVGDRAAITNILLSLPFRDEIATYPSIVERYRLTNAASEHAALFRQVLAGV